MKFYTLPVLRYCYRYLIIAVLVGLPLFLSFSDIHDTEDMLLGFAIALIGWIMIQIAFWEKCFAVLTLTENEIRWTCPLRRTKVISTTECKEMGAYLENATSGIPCEQTYFSIYPSPQKKDKNGNIKATKGIIKFWYSIELYNYLIKNYPHINKDNLISYQRQCERNY